METVKEGTSSYLTVTFLDKEGLPAAPASATYQVHDVLTGDTIRDTTAITPPASQVEIILTPADNSLVSLTNPEELRRVTVAAVYGANDGVKDEYVYRLKNLVKG